MVNWFVAGIMFGVGLLLSYLAVYTNNPRTETEMEFWAIILLALATLYIGLNITGGLQSQESMMVFEQQKAYLAQHQPDNPVEDAALTQKKIELNEWLYSAQFRQKKFGVFSYYPPSIQEWEPIP